MNVTQWRWDARSLWQCRSGREVAPAAQLVLAFGGRHELEDGAWLDELRARHPNADIVSCSTAGEISGSEVTDGTIVATAMEFDRVVVRTAQVELAAGADTAEAATRLAELVPQGDDLRHVLVFSDGTGVNGSALARGLCARLPTRVTVTGGLSGDGADMKRTLVGLNDVPRPGRIIAIALYGDSLTIGHGCLGGWDPFGPERVITRARGNVLYELDDGPALALYRTYLGEHAAELPSSGLLFPLAVRARTDELPVVRTILAVDEAEGAIVLAGDVPQGGVARLMRANFDRLIEGAIGAARGCLAGDQTPELALLVSCVGRKLLLKQRVDEEVEGVRDALGPSPVMAGFYSYGEISPLVDGQGCELHNQTMTITTFSEARP